MDGREQMPPTKRRFHIPGWVWVVGVWIGAFFLLGRAVAMEDARPAYEQEALALSWGLAGVAATLVWAGQRRRDAWRCIKALAAGLALSGVGYWLITLAEME